MTDDERRRIMHLEVGPKPEVEAFGRLFRRAPEVKIGLGNNGLMDGSRELGTWSCLEAERVLSYEAEHGRGYGKG